MNLTQSESMMLKDALIEHWHNCMKHSKNEKMKEEFRCMKEDFKQMLSTRGKSFTITVNS